MLLFFVALFSGVLTVLAPCILPLLPVIVGGSITGGVDKKRAYIICASLAVSVIAFTLILKVSTALIGVPQHVWEWISGGILILLGITTVFPALWERLPFLNKLSVGSNRAMSAGYMKHSVTGDILVGAALGPVFTTCSPTYFVILATILPAGFLMGFVDLLAYTAGLTLTLLLIALIGQRVVDRLGLVSDPRGWFRRAIGILFVLIGLLVFTGTQRSVETWLLDHVFDVTKLEQKLLEGRNSSADMPEGRAIYADASDLASLGMKASRYPRAPELVSPDGYLNTNGKPITIGEFKGKNPVLIDIWTYSCINCQRTLPYLRTWYEKYEQDGLVIIGVHTPEFAFEKVQSNVERAVREFGLKYPVVLDNEYRTWNAFGNHYWPRKYLIDIDGYIVYDHSGEGDYDGAEQAIQKVLAERAERLGGDMPSQVVSAPPDMAEVDFSQVRSPEVYFGSARNEYLGNGEAGVSGVQKLDLPEKLFANTLYLGGAWDIQSEYARNTGMQGQIRFIYSAKNVYFVGSADEPVTVKVTRDGGRSLGEERGADVREDGTASIREDRLYKLIEGKSYGTHLIEIIIEGAGLEAYTFTFG